VECVRPSGGDGIRYGRVLKAADDLQRFSVDVVDMKDVVGPHHVHPQGEIDLIMPLEGDALFDGHPAGWCVYPPGSSHRPTVTQGRALVLYLLPEGQIEFTRAGSFVAPVEKKLSIGGEFGDAIVAVAVGDVDAAVGCERDVGRKVEVSGIDASNFFGADG